MTTLIVSYIMAICVATFAAVIVRRKLTPTLESKGKTLKPDFDQRIGNLEAGLGKILSRLDEQQHTSSNAETVGESQASSRISEYTTPDLVADKTD